MSNNISISYFVIDILILTQLKYMCVYIYYQHFFLLINFPPLVEFSGSRFKSAKHRVDGIDKDNLTYSYTTIEVEGGAKKDVIESVSNVVKIEPSATGGGSICKTTCTYQTKGDAQITEEEIKGEERVSFMFKTIEAYLLANPDAYN